MKFYKVIYTIKQISPYGLGEREVTEYMTARDKDDIINTCKRRFGKLLIQIQYKEINEKRIPKGTSIYVAL